MPKSLAQILLTKTSNWEAFAVSANQVTCMQPSRRKVGSWAPVPVEGTLATGYSLMSTLDKLIGYSLIQAKKSLINSSCINTKTTMTKPTRSVRKFL